MYKPEPGHQINWLLDTVLLVLSPFYCRSTLGDGAVPRLHHGACFSHVSFPLILLLQAYRTILRHRTSTCTVRGRYSTTALRHCPLPTAPPSSSVKRGSGLRDDGAAAAVRRRNTRWRLQAVPPSISMERLDQNIPQHFRHSCHRRRSIGRAFIQNDRPW